MPAGAARFLRPDNHWAERRIVTGSALGPLGPLGPPAPAPSRGPRRAACRPAGPSRPRPAPAGDSRRPGGTRRRHRRSGPGRAP
ncbi:MAG: hypothetical protein DLM59_02715 [Pseudonocardiales bacterium]|nr:MAG: hypothetical protein DLM59_02715 [Pseudonocardiales bacterium]